MVPTMTSIRLNTELADEAAEALGVKTRTEAIHEALKEVIGRKSFQKLLTKNGGKLTFARVDE
jgi:Arc/MetJ family transcription regulator